MSRTSRLLRLVITVDRESLRLIRHVRATVVLLVATSIVVIDGDIRAVLPFGIGLLFAAIADRGGPARPRLLAILGAAITITATCAIGGAVADHTTLHVIVGALVALACGFAGAAGLPSMTSGVLGLVVFTIFSGAPITLLAAERNVAWIAAGAGVQLLATAIAAVFVRESASAPAVEADPTPYFTRLRAAANLRDQYTIHAVRLAGAIAVATLLEELLSFPHSYWIPLTVAWIARPDRDGTVERVVLRLFGTLLGVAVTGAILVVFEPGTAVSLVLAAISSFVVLTFLVPNYAIAVAGITGFVFCLFHLVGYPDDQTIFGRLVATFMGAAIVVVAASIGTRRARANAV